MDLLFVDPYVQTILNSFEKLHDTKTQHILNYWSF